MSSICNLTLDQQGIVSYGLDLAGATYYNNAFNVDDEVFITLDTTDRYAFFFPSDGTFFVASDPNDAIPSVASGSAMQSTNSVQNIAHIGLANWPFSADSGGTEKRIYIKSAVQQSLTVVLMKRMNI